MNEEEEDIFDGRWGTALRRRVDKALVEEKGKEKN